MNILRTTFPAPLFLNFGISRTWFFLRGEGLSHPKNYSMWYKLLVDDHNWGPRKTFVLPSCDDECMFECVCLEMIMIFHVVERWTYGDHVVCFECKVEIMDAVMIIVWCMCLDKQVIVVKVISPPYMHIILRWSQKQTWSNMLIKQTLLSLNILLHFTLLLC